MTDDSNIPSIILTFAKIFSKILFLTLSNLPTAIRAVCNFLMLFSVIFANVLAPLKKTTNEYLGSERDFQKHDIV